MEETMTWFNLSCTSFRALVSILKHVQAPLWQQITKTSTSSKQNNYSRSYIDRTFTITVIDLQWACLLQHVWTNEHVCSWRALNLSMKLINPLTAWLIHDWSSLDLRKKNSNVLFQEQFSIHFTLLREDQRMSNMGQMEKANSKSTWDSFRVASGLSSINIAYYYWVQVDIVLKWCITKN